MTTFLLQLAYCLRHHHLGEWSLERWGVTLAFGSAGAILLLWWLRGMSPVSLLHWAGLALIALFAAGLAYLGRWASRRMYVLFKPQPDLALPTPACLDPADKVLVHPTGEFEVEGKARFFADLLAYWRTFANREHAIMAIVHRSRFLLLGQVPEQELGMWYIFFTPETVESIVPGTITFGRTRRQGLRVAYRHLPASAANRKPPKPATRIVYLGFEEETARQAVWADMLVDNAERRMQNAE